MAGPGPTILPMIPILTCTSKCRGHDGEDMGTTATEDVAMEDVATEAMAVEGQGDVGATAPTTR